MFKRSAVLAVFGCLFAGSCFNLSAAPLNVPCAPAALAYSAKAQALFAVCSAAGKVAVLDATGYKLQRFIDTPSNPSGVAVSADGTRIFVTCAAPESTVAIFDSASGNQLGSVRGGHTACSPVLAPGDSLLAVCNRFDNEVALLDSKNLDTVAKLKVSREPVASAFTPDGKFLLVVNLLPAMAATDPRVAAVVSVIDVRERRVCREILLPNGSSSATAVAISPDGRFAVVTHILSRFHLPTTQLDRGWMNTNGKTLIDLARMEIHNTVLLDNVDSGAANPVAAVFTADGESLVVAHAGTHEVSVIDFPALLAKLDRLPVALEKGRTYDYNKSSQVKADVPNDLAFLVDVRRRVKLGGAYGPRALAVSGSTVHIANYFSDNVTSFNPGDEHPKLVSVALGTGQPLSGARLGEFYFHDAGICFQGWQSCASCHPGNARVDALNWDLLNDGIGNPKNTKSLLLSHGTPPSMSMGVRETAEAAVRAGIQHILFTVQPPEVGDALDVFLKNQQPLPSPYLVRGQLSPAAKRGEKIFFSSKSECATCHPKGLLTDMRDYDVGTAGPLDRGRGEFDTPTLVEIWRTAPYLHDGSAATLKEVLTTRNPEDRHGVTSYLKLNELDDLIEYLHSL